MSVNVSNGSLDFVSTLDNSDFQAKTLADIQLIRLRLELTGDTEGINRYDQAVKRSLQEETKLRNDLNKILVDAKVKTEDLSAAVNAPKKAFSDADTAAEIAAYTNALNGLESGATIVADLNAQLDELVIKQEALNTQFQAGAISEAEYAAAMEQINLQQLELVTHIKQVNDSFASNVIIQGENIVENEKATASVVEQIGVLEELKITLAELKELQFTAPLQDLPGINQKIQETEANIVKFTNIGKVGFDEFGNKIKDLGKETEEATTKQNAFQRAVDRVTNISNIGARIVTQFTRQIISLGVGFLSLEIGAKAIRSLIEYIGNLDIFTGRLDQARQNLEALNEVMANADKSAGTQIATLRELYDAATDTNKSMKDRLSAAEQLRDSYAAEFENANALTIVNGKLKTSYDELSNSIIAVAKSQAASKKIADLSATILDAEYQIEKNNIDKAQQDTKAYQQYLRNLQHQKEGTDFQVKGPTFATPSALYQENLNQIKQQTDISNLVPSQKINIANGQIKFLEGFVLNVSKSATDLKSANKLLGDNLQNFDNLINGVRDVQDLKNIQAALQAKLNSLTPSDAQFADIKAKLQRVDDLIKEYNVKATKQTTTDPRTSLLAAQTTLLQNIEALKQKYAAKDADRENQNLLAINAAYKKQYDAIVAFNVKRQALIDDYNKNHNGTGGVAYVQAKGIVYQDPNQIKKDQNNAIDIQAALNENTYIEADIAKKKKMYADYEAYRSKVGETVADNDYADLLRSGKDFQAYLLTIKASIDQADTSGPVVARKEAIQKALDENTELQLVQLEKLKEQYATYSQQRDALISTAQDNQLKLIKAGDAKAAQQVAVDLQDQLTQLDATNFEKADRYKRLYTNIQSLTTDNAKQMIASAYAIAQAELAAGLITADAYDKIVAKLNGIKAAINDRDVQRLVALGGALSSLGTSFANINSGIGSYIGSLGSLVSAIGTVGKAYEQMIQDSQDAAKKQADEINLVGEGISGLVSLIGTITSAAAARKQSETDYYNSVLSFQNAYNLALNEQIRLQYQSNQNIFFTDFAAQLSDASKALADANSKFNASLQALSQGQAIVGQKNVVNGKNVGNAAISGATTGAVIGSLLPGVGTVVGGVVGGIAGAIAGIFGGKSKASVLAPLLTAYPDLIKTATNGTVTFNEALAKTLIANNQVSASTKILLQNTIDLNDARKAAIDQINSALSTLSANLGTNLENALVTAFENGTSAAKAFGDSVSAVIGNIVQQFLFEDVFGDQFKKLQANLQNTVQAGGSSADITADFVNFFKQAGPLVQQFNAGLAAAQSAGAASGLNLFPSTTASQSTLAGGIQASITEATGTIIAGTLNGIQLNTLTTNTILEGHSLTFGQLLSLAQDQLTAMLAIQTNTKRSADNSDLMTVALNTIVKNTSVSADTSLRAAGKYGY